MPRQARLKIAEWPWHVYQRGVNRCRCFVTDIDRRHYLSLLAEHALGARCQVHAFVLMPNHVHLLVTPSEDLSVSTMMKAVNERYVRTFNRRHKRTGTLWEGRFRSSIIETDRYLLTCQRYIELNPVRASLVVHPADYAWSSYLSNAEGKRSPLLTPHSLYTMLGPDDESRRARYREMFRAPPKEEDIIAIREAALGGFVLGGAIHQGIVESHAGRRAQRLRSSIARAPGQAPGVPKSRSVPQ